MPDSFLSMLDPGQTANSPPGTPKIKLIDMLDGTYAVATMSAPAKFANITSAGTTTIKSGEGILLGIVINKAVSNGSISISDGINGTGAKIGTILNPLVLLQSQLPVPIPPCRFNNGLSLVTLTAQDITVFYL